mgnify:CR=1 FL=1
MIQCCIVEPDAVIAVRTDTTIAPKNALFKPTPFSAPAPSGDFLLESQILQQTGTEQIEHNALYRRVCKSVQLIR